LVALTPQRRMFLVKELLKHREIKPKPVKRVWLSKDGKPIKADNSNARALGIPTMYDRAAQAVWRLRLNPVAECWADDRSYGFRTQRSTQD
jgi:RNA-directed DNA polymerase